MILSCSVNKKKVVGRNKRIVMEYIYKNCAYRCLGNRRDVYDT